MGETNGDPVASAFGSLSEAEKLENFDVSTAKLILKQLGIPNYKINQLEDELGPAFGSDWITTHVLCSGDVYLWTTRCFKYNFMDFILAPDKSDILDTFLSGPVMSGEKLDDISHIMVFKHYEYGRFVMTNWLPNGAPSIRIPNALGPDTVYVVPFKNYFTNQFGDNYESKLA